MRNARTADVGSLAYPKAEVRRICGAMAEQRRRDGCDKNELAPQQFLHLVGYRDPNTRRGPGVPPPPPSPKS